ncbi:60S ribosomal protein L7-like 1 [Sarracenia purpurea var. burkii]
MEECTGGMFQIPARKQSATANVEYSALQRARDFKSESSFFTISMKSSYVYGSVTLYIPRDFAQKYLWGENIILRVSEGRTWLVKLYRATSGDQFSLGWVSFVRDNNLKVGDVCVFELIKGVEPCLNVIIFRAIKECTGGMFQVPARKESATPNVGFRALQRARDFKSESPFFTISMKSSYVYGSVTLYIPRDFAQKYLWWENVILQVSDGRTWSVKLYRAMRGDQFSLGWVSFVQDNNLKVGDVCVFELIKCIERCLNVIIFRAIEY